MTGRAGNKKALQDTGKVVLVTDLGEAFAQRNHTSLDTDSLKKRQVKVSAGSK